MAVSAVRVSTFKVGRRYCHLWLPIHKEAGATMRARVEWHPCMPVKLSAEEHAQFAAGRDRAIAAVLGVGQRGATIELDGATARLTATAIG